MSYEWGDLRVGICSFWEFIPDHKFVSIAEGFRKEAFCFLLCSLCKSSDTTLIRDVESRLYSKECKNCKATKTVATLKISNKK